MKTDYQNIYFIGIGGIGMSAIARYYNNIGKNVAGYDAVETSLTKSLSDEGILIHYEDDVNLIPENFTEKSTTLVIYTPAIPAVHSELNYFKKNNFSILKRAQILGMISKTNRTVGIAGTHGKTTISSLVAHILKFNDKLNAAFIGGIIKNYNNNFIKGENKPENWIVLEADEFDRSFLNFNPQISLISSIDADHLDIYKNKNNIISAFEDYINLTKETVIINENIDIKTPKNLNKKTYGTNSLSDYYATNLDVKNGKQTFDIAYKNKICKNFEISMPGKVNAENATAAFAIAYELGINPENIKQALNNFLGIERRFDLIFKNEKVVFINDYAHHPAEIQKLKEAVKTFYPNKKITAIFQPHLFTRTRDFADEFANALNDFDDIILLDIYPAREMPIDNVNSQIIIDKITNNNKQICPVDNLLNYLSNKDLEVILTIGAGDIINQVDKIKQHLTKKYNN